MVIKFSAHIEQERKYSVPDEVREAKENSHEAYSPQRLFGNRVQIVLILANEYAFIAKTGHCFVVVDGILQEKVGIFIQIPIILYQFILEFGVDEPTNDSERHHSQCN